MLKLKNVSKYYHNNGITVLGLSNINLEFKIDEFVVITGESGSGKSTLLNVISGLDNYEEGELYINGEEAEHYTPKDFENYRKKYIANVFQNFNLVDSYTVYQNIELALLLNGYKKKEIKNKILNIIEQVGLADMKNEKVSKLSGGQKQRVAIARAIVKDSPIIIADEPTANLDSNSANSVIEILKKVAKDKLVILVTHNVEQVKKEATRIIEMQDGKVIKDDVIKKIENNITKEAKPRNISLLNQLKIGFRNAFNIPIKFVLLFSIFLFITITFLIEYSSFGLFEYEEIQRYPQYNFADFSDNRILIKKQDKTSFSTSDFNKIKEMSNIDYIVQNDWLIDKRQELSSNIPKEPTESFLSLGITIGSTRTHDINEFNGEVNVGRIPNNENELIIVCSTKRNNITNNLDKILNHSFYLHTSMFNRTGTTRVKVVGIQYREMINDYDIEFYANKAILDLLNININKDTSKLKYEYNGRCIDNENQYFDIVPSLKVEKGHAVVNQTINTNTKLKNTPIKLYVENLYYNEEIELIISSTYNEKNFEEITGYNDYRNIILINEEDYKKLFEKPPYQASVYVTDIKQLDNTLSELQKYGFETKKITDYKVINDIEDIQRMKIVKIIVTVILVIVLFVISYLIIKIILKSRNAYYTTLNMLNATYKCLQRIIGIELFVDFNFAYIVSIFTFYLIKTHKIGFEYLIKLANYIGFKEYFIIYVLLMLLCILMSRRFSKKIFKNTIINSYNEEV